MTTSVSPLLLPMLPMLPEDILGHCIYSYLSIEDRVALNSILPRSIRWCARIPKETLMNFTFLYCKSKLKMYMVNNEATGNCYRKRRLVLRMFKHYKRYAPMLQICMPLRTVYLTKLAELSCEREGSTPAFVRSLRPLADEIRASLDTSYPYLGERKIRYL